jgi:hypothetical protein
VDADALDQRTTSPHPCPSQVAIPALGALGSLAYLLLGSFLGSSGSEEVEEATAAKESALQRSGLGDRRVPPRRARSAGETVIVVGAGTAGAAAAVGLAERGFKVLLFERVRAMGCVLYTHLLRESASGSAHLHRIVG